MTADILDLKGRIALITGAGQGVGKAVALLLAQHNSGGIIVNDFYKERAEAVAEEIEKLGGRVLPVACDVSDYGAVKAMVDEGAAKFGGLHILVNNAGNAGPNRADIMPTPFVETGPEDWGKFVGVNFFGVINCCHAAIPHLTQSDTGRIVTVVSDAGRVGEPHLEVYAGAKAGAAGFMRALSKSLGRYQVTANCVSLGTIRADEPADPPLELTEREKKALREYTIRRFGTPDDVAGTALFLASDAAQWITGQTIPVNGGYSFAL